MTKEQKRLIDQYRQSGMKYSEIARTIGLPETTVKSYCYRNPVTNPQPIPTGTVCPQCGKPIVSGKFRPRRFCSDACRNKYWLTHHEAAASRAGKKVICQTSPPAMEVTSMSEEQFDRELKFQVSMALVDEMLEKGIIGQEDYEKWLRHMTQKYNPPIGRVVSKKSS